MYVLILFLLLQTSPATQPPPLPSLYAEVRKVESKTESPPPPPVPEQKFDFSGGDNLKWRFSLVFLLFQWKQLLYF